MLIQFSEQSDWLNPLTLTPSRERLVGLTDGRQLWDNLSNLNNLLLKD